MTTTRAKWNGIYQMSAGLGQPMELLQTHACLLPTTGKALDLACGLGANALMLAAHGLSVDAIDISDIALARLQTEATNRHLAITTWQHDLSTKSLPDQHYDVIVICRFLDRTLSDAIMAALKPAGLLFYQTFTRDKISPQGPVSPDYLLARNELLDMFKPLHLVFYQEIGRIGDLSLCHGNRNEACFIGQKPQTQEYA